jgi:hypothetical protein
VSARGTGRAIESRPEDALSDDLAPFHSEETWQPWGHRPVTMPAKVAMDAHAALVKDYRHAGAFHCPCPLARAIFGGRLPGQ